MFSLIQKLLIDAPLKPMGFIIPFLFGGLAGGLISIYINKVKKHDQLEFSLRVKESELTAITSASPIGIGMVKNRGITRVNDFFCEMLGYESHELVGQSARILYPSKEDFDRVAEIKYAQIREKGTGTIDTKMRRKNGEIIYVILSSTPLDQNDWSKGVAFTAVDITERKEMEIALEKSKESYKQAHEAEKKASLAKNEFLANMSHEIRTPLNGINGMLQLIHRTKLDDEQDEFCRLALDSCARLTRLLGDILNLTRIESGRLEIVEKDFRLSDVFDSVDALFKSAANSLGLYLEFRIDPSVPEILVGDQNRLIQVLNNLVGNSIKFTKQGGVKIEASLLPRHVTNGLKVLFSVSDTGIGVPEDKHSHIFQSFSQVDESYTRLHQGAGLGLAIVKRLVDMMGGNISIVSKEGEGTTIHFSARFQAPARKPELVQKAGVLLSDDSSTGMRILLAEDDPVNQLTVGKALEKVGCLVKVVSDGNQAILELGQNDYDLIFMDIQMPSMSGVEATVAIRNGKAGNENRNIPIVALTAYAMAGDEEAFYAAGMNHYLAKPVQFNDIHRILNEYRKD